MFKDKTIIVTGAAQGIGRSIAHAFLKEQGRVILADINESAGQKIEQEWKQSGLNAHFIGTDVSDPASVQRLFREIDKICDEVHILINNAGISFFKPFFELDLNDWNQVIQTNLQGAWLCAREAAQRMKTHTGGRIVHISSTRASMSEPGSEAYAASKGGLLALTHAMALSLAPYHITVNAISPGWVHTGDRDRLRPEDHRQHPSGRVGKPEDIARTCLFLCHPENDFITGEELIVDGGMTRKMIYQH
ncbi:SDR family oxidoreductase [Balneolaceae bacterium ANBcel3]|nr:SDR family oxidoreductase [Balneolaceae bacterium ANBcel3]